MGPGDSPRVAILIPTMNRPGFVLRQLTYYAQTGRHTVYVGDSSRQAEADRLAEGIASLSGRLRVVHLLLPGVNDFGAVLALCRAATEPYVAVIGDDDFFIPAALDQCAGFLDGHPDYASAHGKAVLLRIDQGREYGDVVGASRYPQRPAEEPSAQLRLTEYLHRYWTICFSVQRRTDYLDAVERTALVTDKSFRELVASCLAVVRGRSKELDCLYLIRQVHPGRYLLPDTYDWLTGEEWYPSYVQFARWLTTAVAERDSVSEEVASVAVKRALWGYLAAVLTRRAPTAAGTAPNGAVRRWARRVPLARTLWRLTGVFRAAPADPLALSALLRPSSPYHHDFMVIYRTVQTLPAHGGSNAAPGTDAAHA